MRYDHHPHPHHDHGRLNDDDYKYDDDDGIYGTTPRTSNMQEVSLDRVFRTHCDGSDSSGCGNIAKEIEIRLQGYLRSSSSNDNGDTGTKQKHQQQQQQESNYNEEDPQRIVSVLSDPGPNSASLEVSLGSSSNDAAQPSSQHSTPRRSSDGIYYYGHGTSRGDGVSSTNGAFHNGRHGRDEAPSYQPSTPQLPRPNSIGYNYPRSASVPNMNYYNLPSPVPQQRKTVKLIDLIDEEFVVNSGAFGKSSSGTTVGSSSITSTNTPSITSSHVRRCSSGSPRQHRRRKSILDMMDRIDQLDHSYDTNNNNNNNNEENTCANSVMTLTTTSSNDSSETISTRSSTSSSSSSSTSMSSSNNFMTSRSYPRGVYIVPYNAANHPKTIGQTDDDNDNDNDNDDLRRSSFSRYTPSSSPSSSLTVLVSSEAFVHWNE